MFEFDFKISIPDRNETPAGLESYHRQKNNKHTNENQIWLCHDILIVIIIPAALGHEIGSKTTGIYIDYNQKKVNEANRKVIDYINNWNSWVILYIQV